MAGVATGGRITVHILNTAAGKPASGVAITLVRIEGELAIPLGGCVTNDDGRADAPLLSGAALVSGLYEVLFEIGAWEQTNGAAPGFYDVIPIRFRVTDPAAHYHIPLLLAPFGYATYRGS